MKTIIFCCFFLIIFLCACSDNGVAFTQYFIENKTSKTFYMKIFWGNTLMSSKEIKPKKRLFLDGFAQYGDTQHPVGVITIRADSIVIELENKKIWTNVCKVKNGEPLPANCSGERSLFNWKDFKLVTDNGRVSYYNRIFEFDENDAKNAK